MTLFTFVVTGLAERGHLQHRHFRYGNDEFILDHIRLKYKTPKLFIRIVSRLCIQDTFQNICTNMDHRENEKPCNHIRDWNPGHFARESAKKKTRYIEPIYEKKDVHLVKIHFMLQFRAGSITRAYMHLNIYIAVQP